MILFWLSKITLCPQKTGVSSASIRKADRLLSSIVWRIRLKISRRVISFSKSLFLLMGRQKLVVLVGACLNSKTVPNSLMESCSENLG